jgi:PPK2 family polyphosphate:nucleotide phosphotransferase
MEALERRCARFPDFHDTEPTRGAIQLSDMAILDHRELQVEPGQNVALADIDAGSTGVFDHHRRAKKKLHRDIKRLAELQSIFYASGQYALLIVLQGMDTAGKDSAIKHVMTGVNPQGVDVTSFKAPSTLELEHDYLWRTTKALPPRGRIGIFNRSYYEELLVARVHGSVLDRENLPPGSASDPDLWKDRFEDINGFERHLSRNGTVVVKLFLHLSQDEQRKRLLARIDTPDKNWKFSAADVHERTFWNSYQCAYEQMLEHTSTAWAPWYIVPADHKWFTRVAVAGILVAKLESLGLAYPQVSDERRAHLAALGKQLTLEGDDDKQGEQERRSA